ncbi:L,D-transpeptidase family protein [Roseobacter sp.]|uniref:L,D-transpeptidase family protein n=1 Tax=Roseobacter sp. TaxID=1907202 RepID=UPI003299CE0F
MRRRELILTSTAAMVLAGCAGGSKFRRYDGPEVTFVVVNKGQRRMHLLHNDTVLKSYDIQLGFAPIGDKEIEGDGKTPEGVYRIDRRNPNSRFHLSLGINYPNVNDVAAAKALGQSPGGDIFIHGQKNPFKLSSGDWTWGCIAVTNEEIEEIYAMVANDTLIAINP